MRTFAIQIAIFLGLLLILEGAVRILMPQVKPLGIDGHMITENRFGPTFGYTPGATGYVMGANFTLDDLGLRIGDGRVNPLNDPDTVMIVGDSVPSGVGVDHADIFASRLAADRPVLNTSVGNHNIRNIRDTFAFYAPQAQFSQVWYFLTLNDLYNLDVDGAASFGRDDTSAGAQPSGFVDQLRSNGVLQAINGFFRKQSRLFLVVKNMAINPNETYYAANAQVFENTALVDQLVDQVAGFAKDVTATGADFRIILLPYEVQLRDGFDYANSPQAALTPLLTAQGLKATDLRDEMVAAAAAKGAGTKDLYLYGDGLHLSPLGHGIVAGLLADF